MTKEEFIERLVNQFNGMAANVRRSAEKEIEGERGRMSKDADGFNAWLRAEQTAALQTPALKVFDLVLRASMGTPKEAAQALANFIAFDHQHPKQVVDWQYQFEQAAPILTNHKPEKSDGWKYRQNLVQYVQAMKAEERAKAFSDYLGGHLSKSDFVELVAETLKDIFANSLERFTSSVIVPNQQRMNTLEFGVFIENIRAEILSNDGWKPFDEMRATGLRTYKGVAVVCAHILEQEGPPVDWYQCWTNSEWLNVGAVKRFVVGLELEAKHKAIERFCKKTPGNKPAVSEPPAFADLFTSPEAMEKALAAALKVHIINEANRWNYGRKVGAIVVFWEFLRGRVDVVNRSHENNPLAIDSIAAYFGKPISDRTKRDVPSYRGELLKALRAAWE